MCDYQGYEFGAGHYPDSVCIEGRLFDADACDGDGNLYDNEEDIPCPMCRPTESVSYWAERNRFGGDIIYWAERNRFGGDIDHDEAMAMAMSLVTDIRANRGVFDDFEPPAATCNDLTHGY